MRCGKDKKDSVENKKQPSGIFQCLSLVLFEDEGVSDIYDLYKLLGIKNLIKLVQFYDGKVFQLPTAQELQDAILFSLCFYYREVEHQTWEETLRKLPMTVSALQMDEKIKQLNKHLHDTMIRAFQEGDANV